MARAARAHLADARAIEEQNTRQQMHGGAAHFIGAGAMVGAGATPSMGLSQFRGGMSHKCPKCHRKRCVCEESSSDEDMEGGAWFNRLSSGAATAAERTAAVLRRFIKDPSYTRLADDVVEAPSSALVAINRGTSSVPSLRSAMSQLPALPAPSTALALRGATSTAMVPYNAAKAAAALRAATAAGETTATVASKLSKMGISKTRIAAALAIGIPAIALAAYFGSQSEADAGDSGFYYPEEPPPPPPTSRPDIPDRPDHPDHPPPPPPPPPPPRPGDTDYPGYPGYPGFSGQVFPGQKKTRGRKSQLGVGVATGNLSDEYFAAQRGDVFRNGAGKKPRGSASRAAIVSRVMREKKMSLPAASKYVKEHGLY